MKKDNFDWGEPYADPEQISAFDHYRITVLQPDLIRVETSENGAYTDSRTLAVWNRRFPKCEYDLEFGVKYVVVTTSKAKFYFDRKAGRVTEADIGGRRVVLKKEKSMPGTARTLDMTMGNVRLGPSFISRHGAAAFADDTLEINERGEFRERKVRGRDEYIFAAPSRIRTLELMFMLTGRPPLIPRNALGNWWSRYYAYSADEFLALMNGFERDDIPFSVACIDMDWHWTDPGKRFGYRSFGGAYMLKKGWTGYTWNSELFPDHRAFLKKLKDKGLTVLLNLHPAGGVRSFEAQYPEMARRAGVKNGERVRFDPVSEKAWRDYFEVLMHPYEEDGVDYWWIDWQQGRHSEVPGLDPLWALNHYHYTDSARNGRRGMILSRYSGAGAHRYPVGFSGDSIIAWRSLRFQPYFTASASNVGYTVWSHDIGGHTLGNPRDDELYLRWIQFGVYSPILRLHSSENVAGKEPKNHPAVEREAKEALRFRMRLVPYIYSANYFCYRDSVPLIRPLYYHNLDEEAYVYKNVYYFGTQLIVAPVTSKTNKKTGLAKVRVWLPKGNWIDIHTGEKRTGGSFVAERDLESVPAYLKEGGILPLAEKERRDTALPETLELVINPGKGKYTLFEDDGVSRDYERGAGAFTEFRTSLKNGVLTIKIKVTGDEGIIPAARKFVPNVLGGKWTISAVRAGTVSDGAIFAEDGCAEIEMERRDASE